MPFKKAIGGFLELEQCGKVNDFHSKGFGFSNGRTCFGIILQVKRPSKVYVPYYCCDTLLSPLTSGNIGYDFYPINERFEPLNFPVLKDDEMFLYINYFGLKTLCAERLVEQYKDQVIIDDTQNYFSKGYGYGWSFNSARKFFGVPDGGYLYSPFPIELSFGRNKNYITDHLILRLDERQEEAYEFFRKNENLQNSEPFLISHFSESVLKHVDYESVAVRRRKNFDFYARHLGKLTEFHDLELQELAIPFCYPFLSGTHIDHTLFYANNIYLPVLWKELSERTGYGDFSFEKRLGASLLPLPVDHRYSEDDLVRIINLLI